MKEEFQTPLPTRWVGPIRLCGDHFTGEVSVPLATYETPLWPSVARGARLSRLCGGIEVVLKDRGMARSILMEAPGARAAAEISSQVSSRISEMQAIVESTSSHARFGDVRIETVGPLIFLRLSISTGGASGHNMVTRAAEALLYWLISAYPDLREVSVSGNFCTDKKVSAVNGLLGRGRNVTAEISIPEQECQKYLRASPTRISELNLKKNLVGSTIAGSLRSANAHYANILLALYLATGQDAANIVEGSQGITYSTVDSDGGLRFSVNIPNIIVGVVGNGKHHDFVRQNLQKMGCDPKEGETSADKLAEITAAAVLCGELSLMAALANPGELVHTHMVLERNRNS